MFPCEGSIIRWERGDAGCREIWCCSTGEWDGDGVDDAALFLAFWGSSSGLSLS